MGWKTPKNTTVFWLRSQIAISIPFPVGSGTFFLFQDPELFVSDLDPAVLWIQIHWIWIRIQDSGRVWFLMNRSYNFLTCLKYVGSEPGSGLIRNFYLDPDPELLKSRFPIMNKSFRIHNTAGFYHSLAIDWQLWGEEEE